MKSPELLHLRVSPKSIAMNLLAKSLTAMALITAFSFSKPVNNSTRPVEQKPAPKIQVAILLDVSGSMSGLIEQAKAQLWNMVTTLGKAQCSDKSSPQIELALYEYGRTNNDVSKGYVKQLSPFTNDLDQVSQILFGLNTNGGDEYCGQVIYTSMEELTWDASPENYKVIFIAGNEDFLQGNLHYTKACSKAKDKGVIVNTIYCGNYQQGIAEHWNLSGECGNGTFTNIDHNAKEPDIPTPYDTTLIVLNGKLNNTYIGYGSNGNANVARQMRVDGMNYSVSSGIGSKRVEAKAKSNVYNNSSWDLVDAYKMDSASSYRGNFYKKLDKNTLSDTLKTKSTEQLEQIVKEKSAERTAIQNQIISVSADRDKYIAEQKAKNATANKDQTLETAVEKTIREQVKRFNMVIQ